MGLDTGSYRPAVRAKVGYAGANATSFARAAQFLQHLAEVTGPVKQVERRTRPIGQERVGERQAEVTAWQAQPLAPHDLAPPGGPRPAVAVVEMDGGRLQIRGHLNAVETPEAEKRAGHWREAKVGCALTLHSTVVAKDPCPTIPAGFIDPRYALKVAKAVGRVGIPDAAPAGPPVAPADPPPVRPGRLRVVSRTVVASRQTVGRFGPTLAAAAWRGGFFQADGRRSSAMARRRRGACGAGMIRVPTASSTSSTWFITSARRPWRGGRSRSAGRWTSPGSVGCGQARWRGW